MSVAPGDHLAVYEIVGPEGRSFAMVRLVVALIVAVMLPSHTRAQVNTSRPLRIVLIVDATDAIRQPIGQIRKALASFVEDIDARHEMMLVTVAGTPQIRVKPTGDRQQMVKSVQGIFGTSGSNRMHRIIDDLFHRFAEPADRRPIFVVLTTEGYESTQNINPQEIAHVTNHFVDNGGTLHAVRLQITGMPSTFREGNVTDLPVSLMIARATHGAYTNISPAGLLDVLSQLAVVINEEP
jgi:hypothetical protein